MSHPAEPPCDEGIRVKHRTGKGCGEQIDGAQGPIRRVHQIPAVKVGDEPWRVSHKKKSGMIAMCPKESRWDWNQLWRLEQRGIGAIRETDTTGLLGNNDPLGCGGNDLGRHALQGHDEQELFEQRTIASEAGFCNPGDFVVSGTECEATSDPPTFSGKVEFVDGTVC